MSIPEDRRLADRFRGCLYGQAVGDALGAPAFFTIGQTRARIGWIDGFRDSARDHPVHAGFVAGQVTDDTEQAVALGRSIVSAGRVELAAVAAALVAWYLDIGGQDAPFVGPSSRRAIEALRAGADPATTGTGGETNGGSMRIAPVGLLHAERPDDVVMSVVTACLPTHGTTSAISGAAAIASGVAAACAADATVDDVVAAGIRGAELGRAAAADHAVTVPMPSVSARIRLAVDLARATGTVEGRLQQIHDIIGAGLATTEAVPSAFAMLALGDGDPLAVATMAANLSGDADTVGAMATAIAGALRGAECIPTSMREQVDQVNAALDLEGLAEDLLRLVMDGRAQTA